MEIVKLLIMGIIGALIGWLTNKIALVSLFRPYQPKRVLFLKWQGILPKRQSEIAISIGKIVKEELFDIDAIMNANMSKTKIRNHQYFFFTRIKKIIEESNMGEMLKKTVVNKILKEIDVSEVVENKIKNMNMNDLEKLITNVMKKELKHIEALGGILGFIIGLCQGLLSIFL